MTSIRNIDATQLTKPLVLQILSLKNQVWPSERTEEEQYDGYLARNATRPKREIFVIQQDKVCIAHAELFCRRIVCDGRSYEVGCLAGVCVLPERQGEGLGRAIVEAAFSRASACGFGAVLFQTPVPVFYEKLGCKLINNRFFDSTSDDPAANPWWDDYIMIYPNSHPWLKGHIDLNGGAF